MGLVGPPRFELELPAPQAGRMPSYPTGPFKNKIPKYKNNTKTYVLVERVFFGNFLKHLHYHAEADMDLFLELLGLIAGAVTSIGFLPQIIQGYKTKKLEDVSIYMPIILAIGMTLWFIYGVLKEALAVVIANAFGVTCCLILITMKKIY